MLRGCFFFFFFVWVTGELSTLHQVMEVPNEPGLPGVSAAVALRCSCKVSSTDRPDVGIGKRRGQQVKPLGANGCLVAKDLISVGPLV